MIYSLLLFTRWLYKIDETHINNAYMYNLYIFIVVTK